MKKTLSLFLSLILILSVSLSSISIHAALLSPVSLAGVLVDISGENINLTAGTGTTKKLGDKITIYGPSENSNGEINISVNSAYFGENAVVVNQSTTGSSESNDMRFQISMGGLNSGKATFTYGFYLATDSSRLNLRLRSGSSYLQTINLMNFGFNPFSWYIVKLTIDFESTSNNCKIEAFNPDGSLFNQTSFTCDFTGKALDNMFIWGTPKSDGMPAGAPDSIKNELAFYAMKDLLIYHEPGIYKSEIASVGSSGEVAHSQKEVSFKLSKNIEGLTKNHIVVKTEGGQENKASSILITSDGTHYTVNATMESDLAPWTSYTLEISPDCYSNYKEVANGSLQNVTAIKKEFHTSAAPFDMREPEFVFSSSQQCLTARTTVINTSGTSADVTFLFVSYTSDGRIKNIVSKTLPDFEAAHPGSDADITAPVEADDCLKLFVIDGWTNRTPLFEKFWEVNYYGESANFSVGSAGAKTPEASLTFGEFNYNKKSIDINISCATSDALPGILTIYKEGQTPSEAEPPAYVDYVLCASDGTYTKNIKFSNDFEFGKYIAEFKAKGASTLTSSFVYYTPEEIKQNKRNKIYADSIAAKTAGELRMVILGVNSADEKVNDNFSVFMEDAGENKYNSVKNKDEVFAILKTKLSSVSSYLELVDAFKEASTQRYNKENTSKPSPSSNNKGYGSSSTVVTHNTVVPSQTDSATDEAKINIFPDMKEHWAEKFAHSLYERGIINGYADNSFGGDNFITRAELAKILSVTFGSGSVSEISFTDVEEDSWYSIYIKEAAADGIIRGYDDGSFKPNASVTKEDAILMLYRALSISNILSEGYTLFADDLEISTYAQAATRCLGEIGIVTGNLNKELKPKNSITRAEVAAIICRSLDYTESH